LNNGVAFAWSTLRVDFIYTDGCVEKTSIATSKYVCKNTLLSTSTTLLGRRLNNHFWRFDHGLSTMADISLTPRVGTSLHIECVRGKLAADHLLKLWKLLTINVVGDFFRVPLSFGVTVASLAVNIETP
jgi:hypothetical protein